MKIKKNYESGSYNLCWRYLKESGIYFLVISILLLVSAIIGFLFPVFLAELIRKIMEDLLQKTEGMNFLQLFFFILKNNVTTAFTGLLSGIILGIFPVFLAVFNGYVLGFISGKTVASYGSSILLRLLPHGIFEIPALILSLGLGLKLARFIFAKNKKKQLIYDLENSLKIFFFIIIPLLVIAGIIETSLILLFE